MGKSKMPHETSGSEASEEQQKKPFERTRSTTDASMLNVIALLSRAFQQAQVLNLEGMPVVLEGIPVVEEEIERKSGTSSSKESSPRIPPLSARQEESMKNLHSGLPASGSQANHWSPPPPPSPPPKKDCRSHQKPRGPGCSLYDRWEQKNRTKQKEVPESNDDDLTYPDPTKAAPTFGVNYSERLEQERKGPNGHGKG